jgi:hypothetical protein
VWVVHVLYQQNAPLLHTIHARTHAHTHSDASIVALEKLVRTNGNSDLDRSVSVSILFLLCM